jgi:SAM-dependent methyltransferase
MAIIKLLKKLRQVLVLEHRLPKRYKDHFMAFLAALGFKKIYWCLKDTRDGWESTLGFANCIKFFKIENSYRKKILSENDYRKRTDLYSQLYSTIFDFLRRKGIDTLTFGIGTDLIDIHSKLFANKIVLDYGCGYGDSVVLLSKWANFVYGFDASSVCIKSAKERFKDIKNVDFIIHANPYLSFDNETIDAAYSNDLIEHLHPEDAFIHLKEVHRVLRQGGNYLFWTPGAKDGPHDCTKWFYPPGFGFKANGGHIKEYTFAELIDILKKIGYSRVELPDLRKEVLIIATK